MRFWRGQEGDYEGSQINGTDAQHLREDAMEWRWLLILSSGASYSFATARCYVALHHRRRKCQCASRQKALARQILVDSEAQH